MNTHREMTLEEALAAYQKRMEKARLMTSKTVRWIVLYNDEEAHVSRAVEPRDYVDVLYNIPVHPWHMNKPSRLLFCYDNGHVNVMSPGELLSKGMLRNHRVKKRGYNRNGCKLMRVFVCDKNDYIVICSRDSKGCSYIKAMPLSSRTAHASMSTPGNIFVENGTPYKWIIVPKELKEWIRPIQLRDTRIGYPLEGYTRYADLVEFEKLTAELSPPVIVGV